MANEHTRRCSSSRVIREMQIETTMRYQYTPIRIVKIRSIDNRKCRQRRGARETLTRYCWQCKLAQPLWKTVERFLRKPNTPLTYEPAIVLLGIYSKELKTYIHTKTCTQMLTAALFITAKYWKQPRCPS